VAVANGEVIGIAVAVGGAALVLILLCQRFLRMVPGVLVAVLLSIAAVRLLDLTSHGSAWSERCPKGSRR
jgi:MFS superfamily sulfate permease-like transporter